MLPRKLAGQLIAGELLVAAAATAALAAAHGGLSATVVLLGLGLAAIAVVTAVLAGRALARPLLGLSRAVERLADTITPRRTWTRDMADRTDLIGLTAELTRMTPRLRDRLDELTEERDRAGQILDALEDGVLLLDGAGRLLLANPAARAWFGLADDLRAGLPARRVLGVPQITDLAAEASSKRAPVTGIVTVVFPEDRTLSVRAFPLADRGLTGRIVVTMADISQRRRLEVLRRDFVANASHELKTPVAAVKALAEALQTALPDDPAASRRLAGRIGRETERLDALVRDLLDLSRVERGTLAVEPVDLTGLVKEVVGAYADRADDRHIELRSELQPGTTVRGDRGQLALLVSNLVDNALRYTHNRGKVHVRLETFEARAVLRVADNGRGIPSNELARVFERFYRVDKARARQTGGTGLGLAIVRHVVEGHGGSVDVESELGRGATFTVSLPVAGPPVLALPG
jgi:two-component system, OmpR family, phosphate regulon sensor histidine kinase PhoR